MTLARIAVWSLLIVGVHAVASADNRPNIVLIMADDLGYGGLGCYGQEKIRTPRLDRMAREGIRFTQAYAGSHVCQPSRCVLMTGKHTGHAAVRANDVRQLLLPEDVTVATVLKRAGYKTAMFGKWGLGYQGTSGHPLRQGFDYSLGQLLQVHAHFYFPYFIWENDSKFPLPGNENNQRSQYVTDVIHQKTLEFIRRNKDERFFVYLPNIIPHVELVVPEDSETPYRGKFEQRPILDPRQGYIGSQDGLVTLAGMISRLDRYVGEIMDLLVELNLDQNTLVIFTSDNGAQSGGKDKGWTYMTDYFQANGNLRGYKGQFYEGGIRVPLIARWPQEIAPGTESDLVCGFWDILPTLAEIGGGRAPTATDGISLLPTLRGRGDQPQHPGIYWEYPRGDRLERAARISNWKAVQKRQDGPVELFDLTLDPGETSNLAAEKPAIVSRMRAFMDRQHQAPRVYPESRRRPGIQDYVR